MPANAKLPLLELGKDKPTMLNLSVANEVLKTVNGVRLMQFLPAGIGKVEIADDQITVTIKSGGSTFGPANAYIMGETAGGSATGGGSGDPPNADLSIARTDTWERGKPTFDIADTITDGVKFDTSGPVRVWVGAITYIDVLRPSLPSVQIGYKSRKWFQRDTIFDVGGLFKITAETLFKEDIEIVSIV